MEGASDRFQQRKVPEGPGRCLQRFKDRAVSPAQQDSDELRRMDWGAFKKREAGISGPEMTAFQTVPRRP